MTSLKIQLYLDPATCIRDGRATYGETTVTLTDEHLSKLTPKQREVLARHVAGHRMFDEYPGWTGPEYGETLTRHAQPIADTSIETIASLLDRRQAVVEEAVRAYLAKREEARQRADAAIAAVLPPSYKEEEVCLGEDGHGASWGVAVLRTKIRRRQRPYVYDSVLRDASPAVVERYEEARREADAERQAEIEALLPQLRDELARREAEAEARRREYDALYARLPKTLRQRREDGYATDEEVEQALRRILRRDAGYGGHDGWAGMSELETLTNDEYRQLVEARASAPEGAEVKAVECWDYREAEEGEEDEADEDGDVRCNVRRQIVIQWEQAGIRVRAVVPFRDRTGARAESEQSPASES